MEDKEKQQVEEPQQTTVEDLLPAVRQHDDQLITEILQESDLDKLKDLTHAFNAFQTKRQILRVSALNDVQDALVQQMADRLRQQPHNFDNKDIALWMKTVQQAMDSAKQEIDSIDDVPTITYQNNTQINVNVEDSLSRESREKILGVLNQILQTSDITAPGTVYLNDEISEDSSINSEINLGDGDNNGNKEDSSN